MLPGSAIGEVQTLTRTVIMTADFSCEKDYGTENIWKILAANLPSQRGRSFYIAAKS